MSGLRRSVASISVAGGVVLALAGTASAQWFDASWQYRLKVTVDSTKVPADQTDAPVLLDLSQIGTGHGFWTNAKDGGGDLVVTEADSTTRVPLEVVSCDTSAKTGEIWFKGDLGSSADTDFYLYYGNAAATQPAATDTYGSRNVWSNGYAGVWHLGEDPSGQITNSAAGANHGTSSGGMSSADQVAGKIDGSLDFDGSDDYVNVGDIGSDSWTAITVECWMYFTGSTDDRVICKSTGTAVADHIFSLGTPWPYVAGATRVRLGTDGTGGGTTSHDSNSFFSQFAWHHAAFSWDSADATLRFWGDGQARGTAAKDGDTIKDSSQMLAIGNINTVTGSPDGRCFHGQIDEARISTVARDANYFQTQYNLTNDQTGFWTVGAEEPSSGPTITQHPQDVTVTAGQTATFTVTATASSGTLSYQWKKDGTDIASATSASYTTPATVLADDGAEFTCVVTDDNGSVTSNAATLTVTSSPTGPTITQQPQNVTVTAGQTATFTVVATTSGGTLSYQWKKDGTDIASATSASYTTPATVAADDGAEFTCVVTDDNGSATSDAATLTVTTSPTGPTITQQPQNVAVAEGETATFTVVATASAGTLSYQWKKDGTNIAGATSASYTTPATVAADNGATFTCVVTDGNGSVTSNSATLSVGDFVLTSITVNPTSAEIKPEGVFFFAATGRDQNGDPMSPQPTITWTVSPATGGTVSPGQGPTTTFTSSGETGAFILLATSGAVQGAATIFVEEEEAEALTGVARGDGCVPGAAGSCAAVALLVAALAAGLRRGFVRRCPP